MKTPGYTRNEQKKTFKAMFKVRETDSEPTGLITATVTWDDSCGNGHNTFSITGDSRHYGSGCIHEEIAKHFPELAPLIKWHLCGSDGPIHYIPNTVYMAGERDHNGLLKGERQQIKNGRTGLPAWHLVAIDPEGREIELHKLEKNKDSEVQPECNLRIQYRPWCITGEGKARDLDAARHSAIWLDATDEELTAPGLEDRLKARLPALMEEFRKAVESLGFTY